MLRKPTSKTALFRATKSAPGALVWLYY